MSNPWIKFLLIQSVMTFAAPCMAADPATDRFAISLGAFRPDRDTETRVDSTSSGQGTSINFEDHLGLDSSQTVIRIDGHYRFAERHRLDFSIFDLSRDAARTPERAIQFGNAAFGVNTEVVADFDLGIYKLGYTYSFVVSDKGFFGSDIGLYVADVGLTLNTPSNDPSESNSLTAPLPVIGLRGEYHFTDRLTLSGDFEWFGLSIDDIRGRLTDFLISTDYNFTDNLAIGIAYNNVTSDIRYRDEGRNSRLNWGYNGFLLYVKMSFGTVPASGGE